MVKNPPANARDIRDTGSVLRLRRSRGEGNGNPPKYSCLENPMDRGASWSTVQRITKSWIPLKCLSTQACLRVCNYTVFSHTLFDWQNNPVKLTGQVLTSFFRYLHSIFAKFPKTTKLISE